MPMRYIFLLLLSFCSLLASSQGNDSLKVNGKLPGLFSVSDSLQVQFSMGNLQYQPSSDVWRFATNQYDVLDYERYKVSAEYNGWLDAFAWGSSGYGTNSDRPENERNLPYIRGYERSFYEFPHDIVWMTEEDRNFDWGVYNAISNGGNKPGLWRTLLDTEWRYLLTERPHADELRSFATVCGEKGYLLLPDDFQLPDGLSFTPRSKDYTTNRYDTKEEWWKMELAGALFLPNRCDGGSMGVGYWTARGGKRGRALCIREGINVYGKDSRHLSYVRLVSDSFKKMVKSDVVIKEKDDAKKLHKKKKTVKGALPGLFSVSDGHQIRFAKGNLQYQASTSAWRFAHNQYDVLHLNEEELGLDNDSIRENYSGWVDEFHWATSGYDNRRPTLRKWQTNDDAQFPAICADPDPSGIDDSIYVNYDWGVYNKIDNGGGKKGLWRTLSRTEWLYLLNERRNAENLRSGAVVCGVYGYMILPDDYVFPKDVRFIPQCHDFSNDYNEEQWRRMESAGALFLPCGYDVEYPPGLTKCGGYWTSSSCFWQEAFYFGFEYHFIHKDYVGFDADGFLLNIPIDCALSVRLVTDR